MVRRRFERLPGHGGFTQVELLVAIGIVGLLAALMLPAVQQARAVSRRVVCQNHLKQLGLAITNLAGSTGTFPTASIPESGYRRLLPYLDAAPLREHLVQHLPPPSWSVPVLVCPEDPVIDQEQQYGNASYYFNDGSRFRVIPHDGFSKGAWLDTKPSEVTDGLSQTAAMSERLVRSDPPPSADVMESEPRRFFWFTEVAHRRPGQEAQAIEQCRHHRTTTEPQYYGVHASGYLSPNGYDHMLPPNHPACYNGPEDFDLHNTKLLIPASSLHAGGVHVLMGDGSVHFASEAIDAAVWQALGTRAGHESVAVPF